jgi:hypothetical protein
MVVFEALWRVHHQPEVAMVLGVAHHGKATLAFHPGLPREVFDALVGPEEADPLQVQVPFLAFWPVRDHVPIHQLVHIGRAVVHRLVESRIIARALIPQDVIAMLEEVNHLLFTHSLRTNHEEAAPTEHPDIHRA